MFIIICHSGILPFTPSATWLSFTPLYPGKLLGVSPANEWLVCPVKILPFVDRLIAKKKKHEYQ